MNIFYFSKKNNAKENKSNKYCTTVWHFFFWQTVWHLASKKMKKFNQTKLPYRLTLCLDVERNRKERNNKEVE
jgi:hypothetical protein